MSNLIIPDSMDYMFRVNEILNELVMAYQQADDERDKINEQKIINLYYRRMIEIKRIPNFFDLVTDIENANEEVFWEAASVQFVNEFNEQDFDSEDAISDTIDELACQWMELYEPKTNCMALYTAFILNKHRMSCYFEASDEYFYHQRLREFKFTKDISFVFCDCQNILFDSFLVNNCAGYDGYVNFYQKEQLDSNLLLQPG